MNVPTADELAALDRSMRITFRVLRLDPRAQGEYRLSATRPIASGVRALAQPGPLPKEALDRTLAGACLYQFARTSAVGYKELDSLQLQRDAPETKRSRNPAGAQ